MLDGTTLELRRDGVPVPLEPLPATILAALVARAGELLTRRELRELGWPELPDAADQSLNTCLRQIREALGDDAALPRYVETLRGRGYRFADRVERVAESGMDEVPRRSRSRRAVSVAMILATAAVAVGVGQALRQATTPDHVLLAIPTPRPLGEVSETEVVGAALATELRASLATVSPERVRVLGRETTERLWSRGRFTPHAQVPVTHLLELAIQPRAGELRIVAQLLDAATGTVVWADAVDASSARLGAAGASVSGAVARALGVPAAPLAAPDELPLDVRAHLLKTRYIVERHGELSAALAHLDTVVQLRPDLAEAHALRAEVLVFAGRPTEARDAAVLALDLSPAEPGALRATSWLHMLKGEWRASRARLEDILSQTPNDPPTLSALAFLLTVQGRFEEAEGALERTMAADPLAALLVADAGLMYFWAGRLEDAVRACSEAVALRPEAAWAVGCAFDAELRAGRPDRAARWGRRLLAAHGAEALARAEATPLEVVEAVRRWRIGAGEAAVADGGGDAYSLSLAYADAGRVDDALQALEQAAGSPGLGLLSVAVDPRFRVLRDRDRYRAVVTRWRLTLQ